MIEVIEKYEKGCVYAFAGVKEMAVSDLSLSLFNSCIFNLNKCLLVKCDTYSKIEDVLRDLTKNKFGDKTLTQYSWKINEELYFKTITYKLSETESKITCSSSFQNLLKILNNATSSYIIISNSERFISNDKLENDRKLDELSNLCKSNKLTLFLFYSYSNRRLIKRVAEHLTLLKSKFSYNNIRELFLVYRPEYYGFIIDDYNKIIAGKTLLIQYKTSKIKSVLDFHFNEVLKSVNFQKSKNQNIKSYGNIINS